MGCHPSHWLSLHHFSRWWNCTTNQYFTSHFQVSNANFSFLRGVNHQLFASGNSTCFPGEISELPWKKQGQPLAATSAATKCALRSAVQDLAERCVGSLKWKTIVVMALKPVTHSMISWYKRLVIGVKNPFISVSWAITVIYLLSADMVVTSHYTLRYNWDWVHYRRLIYVTSYLLKTPYCFVYILVNICISIDFADRCIGNINTYTNIKMVNTTMIDQ